MSNSDSNLISLDKLIKSLGVGGVLLILVLIIRLIKN